MTQQTTALVRAEDDRGGVPIRSLEDLHSIASVFAQSGYFKDSRDAAQCAVRILAGQELGIGPLASMTGVHLVQGKPEVGAGLQAALVKRSGVYDYRVVKHTLEACAIEFRRRNGAAWEVLGVSEFTLEDAKRAQLMNNPTWTKYPKHMLFARALTSGVAWHCPEVLAGVRCYAEGEVEVEPAPAAPVQATARVVEAPRPAPVQPAEAAQDDDVPDPDEIEPDDWDQAFALIDGVKAVDYNALMDEAHADGDVCPEPLYKAFGTAIKARLGDRFGPLAKSLRLGKAASYGQVRALLLGVWQDYQAREESAQ